MIEIAYVVSWKFNQLNITQVTVERETEKSYILKADHPNGVPIREDIVGNGWGVTRIFPKTSPRGGTLYFSRRHAIEVGVGFLSERIPQLRASLACVEELHAQLSKELSEGASDDRD